MRVALTILLGLHAAAHLLGFLEWSSLSSRELSGQTIVPLSEAQSAAFSGLWLACFVLLGSAVALRIKRRPAWWLLALAGVLVSQVLVVIAWPSASLGTIANVLVFAGAAVAAAQHRFDRFVDHEVATLLATKPGAGSIVEANELLRLPPPVRRWLERSGVVGRARAEVVRLTQRGQLRTSPKASWMAAEAVQHFRADEPAFVWRVKCAMKGLPIVGRDKYVAGAGQMLIKAAGLVTIVDAADAKIAHGALLRFLGELVWFPSAVLRPYVEWSEVDERSARATIRHAGHLASAVFEFDAQGRVAGMTAQRYLGAELTPWIVEFSDWRVVRGVEIPVGGEVSWRLSSGDFTYYRWQILDVDDRPEVYEAEPAPSMEAVTAAT